MLAIPVTTRECNSVHPCNFGCFYRFYFNMKCIFSSFVGWSLDEIETDYQHCQMVRCVVGRAAGRFIFLIMINRG